jgi:adenine phosphoribosyltransferase
LQTKIKIKLKNRSLKKYILDIHDFIRPGIGFKDITPLLINPMARKETLEVLLSSLKDKKN